MAFVGKLDQFKLPDLLQIISGNRKTGRLALTRRDSQGMIVFRSGKIIYAASTAARETLGSLLLCRQLIDEEGLARRSSSSTRPQRRSVWAPSWWRTACSTRRTCGR